VARDLAKVSKTDFQRDMEQASKGNKEALTRFCKWLDDRPNAAGFADEFGNLATTTEKSLLRLAYGEQDLFMQEMGRRKLASMRNRLRGDSSTPLESLLITRIALCWFQLHYYETAYAQNLRGLSLEQSRGYQRRIDSAHRRYLSAIKALAQVRRLLLPTVQVNVGQKQVNIAGACPQGIVAAPRFDGAEANGPQGSLEAVHDPPAGPIDGRRGI
jgi:hypothetical protein